MKTTITLMILAIMTAALLASAACSTEAIDALATQGNALVEAHETLETRVAVLETNTAGADARDEQLRQLMDQLVQAEVAKIQVPAGPRGERGEQGPQGERGEQGQRGERGEQGPQGERGVQGAQGERGIQGARGVQGAQGERGEQGPMGEQGSQGPQGERGEQGPRGARGEQGQQGARGEQGPQGVFESPSELRAERIVLGKDGTVMTLEGGADGNAAGIAWYDNMNDYDQDLPAGLIFVGAAKGEVVIAHWNGSKYVATCLDRGSWKSC